MIDLQEFVAETVRQITAGIADVRDEIKESGGRIGMRTRSTKTVDFDVAVTVVDSSKSKGGVGVFVAGFGAGKSGQMETENSVVSRIQFQVPIEYPTTAVPNKPKRRTVRSTPLDPLSAR